MTVDREIVVLVDDRRGLVVAGVASSTDIVAASMTLGPSQDLAPLVERADLPTHAVTVVPNQGPPRPVHKGPPPGRGHRGGRDCVRCGLIRWARPC